MAIVMISSTYQSGREELAQALARRTNWPILSREELQEKAREMGIKVGRLEVSLIKTPGWPEKLAREKDLYLAFLTASLCEKARQGDFIYTGRAGHLLLPGVNHRLRVGLTAPREARITRTALALHMTRDKAETYITQLDEDIARWMRYVHKVDGRDPGHFDAFFNLENISVASAAAIICEMAELPDFKPTPAGKRLLEDLYLSSQAKVRLALDERTGAADLQVQAENGVVTVTYPPHLDPISRHIPAVISDLPGCREIQCTMAETNILWVQERFAPDSNNFQQIMQLAQRWGAAVELFRLIPPEEFQGNEAALSDVGERGFGRQKCPVTETGGVEDDGPATVADDGGLNRTQEELVQLGRSGGTHTVCGGYDKILERVKGSGHYALVVIGDLFLSKGHSARTRQTRELALNIRDRLKAPVITSDELKERFLFGKRQAVTLVGFSALVAAVYWWVMTNQALILDFLSGPDHQTCKWLSPLVVVVVVPIVAYIYGTVTGLALKLINID
ncbi:MAG: cytidylate kinase family protein [Pseudomonadota bacterium]